jgi:hypothetical protein
MSGHLDMIRHPEVGLGLLLLMTPTLIADIAVVPLMTDGIGIARVVLFADVELGRYLQRSLRPQ